MGLFVQHQPIASFNHFRIEVQQSILHRYCNILTNEIDTYMFTMMTHAVERKINYSDKHLQVYCINHKLHRYW